MKRQNAAISLTLALLFNGFLPVLVEEAAYYAQYFNCRKVYSSCILL